MRPPGPPGRAAREIWVAVLLGAAVLAGAWAWAAGEVATWLASRRWMHIPVSSVPGILGRLPAHLGDPGQAWPAPVRSGVPGPALWYACALSILAAATGAGWL